MLIPISSIVPFWLAKRTCFPNFIEDPDKTDLHLAGNRHEDKYDIRWATVGKAVELIGCEVASLEFHNVCSDECEDDLHQVEVDVSHLSSEEQSIVQRWFQHGVCVEGQEDDIFSGRHRLWNCWSADSELILPVRSSVLVGLVEPPDSDVREIMHCEAQRILSSTEDECLGRSPHYAKVLTEQSNQCVQSEVPEGYTDEPVEPKTENFSFIDRLLRKFCP